MFQAGVTPPPRDTPVHLLRGAPPVRAWSESQTTVPDWTLCGIRMQRNGQGQLPLVVEDAAATTCEYCRCLMRTGAERAATRERARAARIG